MNVALKLARTFLPKEVSIPPSVLAVSAENLIKSATGYAETSNYQSGTSAAAKTAKQVTNYARTIDKLITIAENAAKLRMAYRADAQVASRVAHAVRDAVNLNTNNVGQHLQTFAQLSGHQLKSHQIDAAANLANTAKSLYNDHQKKTNKQITV